MEIIKVGNFKEGKERESVRGFIWKVKICTKSSMFLISIFFVILISRTFSYVHIFIISKSTTGLPRVAEICFNKAWNVKQVLLDAFSTSKAYFAFSMMLLSHQHKPNKKKGNFMKNLHHSISIHFISFHLHASTVVDIERECERIEFILKEKFKMW